MQQDPVGKDTTHQCHSRTLRWAKMLWDIAYSSHKSSNSFESSEILRSACNGHDVLGSTLFLLLNAGVKQMWISCHIGHFPVYSIPKTPPTH